ncbi:hypothetical protein PanWU01x14_361990, partial [Parasponia andersonii]
RKGNCLYPFSIFCLRARKAITDFAPPSKIVHSSIVRKGIFSELDPFGTDRIYHHVCRRCINHVS